MAASVLMSEMSWPAFVQRIEEGAPILLPMGATEQHGPHLPLGVDVIVPGAICERVARRVGGIVAPPIAYGYKSQPRSGGGEGFPGTTSLDAHTLTLVTKDIIVSLASKGARRLVVVIGHVENAWPALEGIDLALRDLRRDGISDVVILRLSYWDLVRPETLQRIFPNGYPGIDLEHASLLETSMMLLLRPDLVNVSLIPTADPGHFPPYDRYPATSGYLPRSGVLAVAEGARAEIGTWLIDDHVALISEALCKEFDIQLRSGAP